jgi:hypothetical protein
MKIIFKLKSILFYSLFIIAFIQFSSCKKDPVHVTAPGPVPTPPPQGNLPPVACAGQNQAITLPVSTVTLDGSCSTDPDNNITNYAWTKISGTSPIYSIRDAKSFQTSVTFLTAGTYLFELKVTDAGGLFSIDTVQITLNKRPPPPAGFGSVSFWKNTDISIANYDFENEYISINGKTQGLDCDWPGTSPQDCDNSCTTQFDLPQGEYEWKAFTSSLGTDTIRGKVTVTAQGCTLQKIDF